MKILVTGANGFIGSVIVESLLRRGHEVIACCRSSRNLPTSAHLHFVPVDFTKVQSTSDWRVLLDGVSAVVNCAGILRETRGGDFERIHLEAPSVLVDACVDVGTPKFIQVSALGDGADGRFIGSKHRFDAHLLDSGLAATVLRPSVVLSSRGSYGGTSLLRAMAALPIFVFLPDDGEQKIQPVLAEDLGEIVSRCLPVEVARGEILQVVGDEVLSLKETLGLLRSWMRFPPPHWIHVPRRVVKLVTWVADRINVGPLGDTMGSMLDRGNIGSPGSHASSANSTGFTTRSIRNELDVAPSFVQDRWHARLYGLRPVLWLILVVTWMGSGLAGLHATSGDYRPILDAIQLPHSLQGHLVIATSLLDFALGFALLLCWRTRLVLGLMLVSVLAYTAILGSMATELWLDPLGGLIKNLAVAGVLLVCLTVEDDR